MSWTDDADLAAIAGVAVIIGNILGKPVERVVLDDDEWTARQVAEGVRPHVADPTLERMTGHPATPTRAVLDRILANR